MKLLNTVFSLLLLTCGGLAAQDITGKWVGTADTIDASGIKRAIRETIEIKSAGGTLSGSLVNRTGGFPLKVIQEGSKVTFLCDLDLDGGEHLRWYFELKDGRLVGKVWSVHDAPHKWGVDWSGPLEMTKSE